MEDEIEEENLNLNKISPELTDEPEGSNSESNKTKKKDLPKWEKEVILTVFNGVFIQRVAEKRKINRRSDAIVKASIIDNLEGREILTISEPAVEINTQTRICIIKANEEEIEAYLNKKIESKRRKTELEKQQDDEEILLKGLITNKHAEEVAATVIENEVILTTEEVPQENLISVVPLNSNQTSAIEPFSEPAKLVSQTNYIVLDNTPKRKFFGWFAIFLVCLFLSVVILGYVLTLIAKPPYSPAVFSLKEDGISWNQVGDLNVFANPELNGAKIIKPGAKGKYDFVIENLNDESIIYWFYMHESNEYNINMKYKLKLEGAYILGSEDKWLNVLDLKQQGLTILSNSRSLYTLEWFWEESEDDVDIAKSKAQYRLHITINAKIEYGA